MRKWKGVLIALAATAVLGAGGFFGWKYLAQNHTDPVKVYSFDFVGMTEYWGDTRESYGPVSTDKMQTIYLTDTQTVSDILVEEGQEVKKGDLLMSFDTTLSQLELERKNLEIQKLELDLEEANKELQRISWMVPMGVPPTEPETEPTVPATVMFRNGDYSLYREDGHDGSTPEAAMICWIPMGKVISTEFLQEQIGELITEPEEEPSQPADPEAPGETEATTEPETQATEASITGNENLIAFTALISEETWTQPFALVETTSPETEPTTAPAESTEPTGVTEDTQLIDQTENTQPTEVGTEPTEGTTAPTEETTEPTEEIPEAYGHVVCNDFVYVRSGPGTEYLAVDTVAANQRVAIYEIVEGTDMDWGRIGQDRWISMNYVVLDGESIPPTQATEPTEVTVPTETTVPTEATEATEATEVTEPTGTTEATEVTEPTGTTEPTEPAESTEATEPTEETEPEEEETQKRCRPYYVVFKVTENNYLRGNVVVWLGVHVNSDGSFSFFDAREVDDISYPEEPPTETEPYVDYIGSGYTASEIKELRVEQEKKIKDLDIQLKLAQSELKIMERELSDGNIYAEIDGTVISLLDEEEAKLNQQPMIKVSGGGGFYVEASISELERDSVEIGQEVTVNDWENGMTYSGTITAIGDIPASSQGYNGMDNPNASSYPMTVFVDESADLREGGYASVQYAASSAQNGIYLQNPFLRTVGDRNFVYVRGEDGLLEERDVTTGKSLWGSYIEIVDGLTAEDLVAFPYGKNVRPGVPTEEGDHNDLYGN